MSTETSITADERTPAIHITRDFAAAPARVIQAHLDPELVAQWMGPAAAEVIVRSWDGRTGGHWSYICRQDGEDYGFFGSFHEVRDDRIVQTFTFEGVPDSASLETLTVEDLGDGRTRLRSRAVYETFEARDGMLASGMDTGVIQGYGRLDQIL